MYRETDFKNSMIVLESELNVPVIKTYDFVISVYFLVGAGTSGSVLAARLSEKFNVLLLEAGGPPPPGVSVPLYVDEVVTSQPINYFFSVPQYNGIIRTATQGKMFGGTGSHNGMAHLRGSPKDFDNWASILNDESFNYTNVLKYRFFIEYYGDGPIVVDTVIFPLLDLWLDAGRELGYRIGDANGFQRESFTPYNIAINNGRRSSSYAEYIKPHEKSRNTLTIIPYANVSQILLNEERKAYGVAYTRHGFPQIAYARNEIILSAGAFSSPLLLMKSGIGPESILNAAEIPVKVPLEAVGKHLKDHAAFSLTDFSVNDTTILRRINSSEVDKMLNDFHTNGTGTFTSNGYDIGHSFIVSSKADSDWPDSRVDLNSLVKEEPTVYFYIFLGRPKSIGILTMDTDKYKTGIRDDGQLALIDFQLLTHPDDVDVILEGIKLAFKMTETQSLQSINMTYFGEPDPVCNNFEFLTDDYWRCKIRYYGRIAVHMSGTCRMGPDVGDSNTSVVDTKFRVRGVTNLRVVDASVFPEITNSNINAAIMMMAEKAAEEIINFYNVLDPRR